MKKKVLHIITRLILGGAQENTLFTVIGLAKKPEYEVVLLSGSEEGPEGTLFPQAKAEGVKLIIVPELVRNISPVKDILALFKIYRIIKDNKFDIVHTHSSKAGIIGRIAAHWAKTPIIVHTLHSLVFHEYQNPLVNRLYIFLKRIAARHTDKFISVADFINKKAAEFKIAPYDKFVTIRSGMKLDDFLKINTNAGANIKRELNIANDCLVVGKVARLFHLKGHSFFLDAAAKVVDKFRNVRFLLVGDGILYEELKRQAEKLGISEFVVFAGLVKQSDVPRYIAAMDIVVHTSLREGLARVMPQAMAAAKPVIAFDADGSAEVIKTGQNGILVAPEDIDALAGAIIDLLMNENKRIALGQQARQNLSRDFTIEAMVDNIDKVYKDLLSKKYII